MPSDSALLEQSAIRRRLSHDLRASTFNIEGFLDELNLVMDKLEKMIEGQRDQLPPDFADAAVALIEDDARDCLNCLDKASVQLQERIDLMTLSVEAPTE